MKLSLDIPGKRRKLGEVLVDEGLISPELLEAALAQQKIARQRLGTMLMDLGLLTPQQFMRALSKQLTVVHHTPAPARG